MVESHQGIVVQSQSLWSAFGDGEHHFESSDNKHCFWNVVLVLLVHVYTKRAHLAVEKFEIFFENFFQPFA